MSPRYEGVGTAHHLCWGSGGALVCGWPHAPLSQTNHLPCPGSWHWPGKPYLCPAQKIKQILFRPKDPIPPQDACGVVYHIKCDGGEATDESPCSESYIGETERSLRSRFLEHRRPSSIHSEVSSCINRDKPSHSVSLANAKMLDREDDWFARGVREAIHIRAHHPSLNKDGGRYQLPHILDSLIGNTSRDMFPNSLWTRLQRQPKAFMQLTHSVLKLIILFLKISFLCNKLFLTNNSKNEFF